MGVVQWSIDQLWSGIQRLENGLKSLKADLNADRTTLTALWSQTTRNPDAKRRADDQALLTPIIHQNSILRTQYLAPLTDSFNRAAAAASNALKNAGYTTPALNGLGVFVLAPAAAVVIVVAALAIMVTAIALTAAQRSHTAAVSRLIGDPSVTPEQKAALLAAMDRDNKSAADSNRPPFSLDQLTPIAMIAAAIFLIPPVLKLLPKGRGQS